MTKLTMSAWHEAGHAIAGLLMGVDLFGVWILKSRNRIDGGITHYDADSVEALRRDDIHKDLALLMAGDAAVELMSGKPLRFFHASMTDYNDLTVLYRVKVAYADANEMIDIRRRYIETAKALLLPHLDKLALVADELKAQPWIKNNYYTQTAKALSAERIKELVV